MNVQDIINKNAICVGFEAADKREAITHIAQQLYQDGAISDVERFVDDVFFRESEGQTGIGEGIAVPHGKSNSVTRSCVAIGTLKAPIAWESIDDEPVSVIFLFAVQDTAYDNTHLKMMATVACALAHDDICYKLRSAESHDDILRIVDEMAAYA